MADIGIVTQKMRANPIDKDINGAYQAVLPFNEQYNLLVEGDKNADEKSLISKTIWLVGKDGNPAGAKLMTDAVTFQIENGSISHAANQQAVENVNQFFTQAQKEYENVRERPVDSDTRFSHSLTTNPVNGKKTKIDYSYEKDGDNAKITGMVFTDENGKEEKRDFLKPVVAPMKDGKIAVSDKELSDANAAAINASRGKVNAGNDGRGTTDAGRGEGGEGIGGFLKDWGAPLLALGGALLGGLMGGGILEILMLAVVAFMAFKMFKLDEKIDEMMTPKPTPGAKQPKKGAGQGLQQSKDPIVGPPAPLDIAKDALQADFSLNKHGELVTPDQGQTQYHAEVRGTGNKRYLQITGVSVMDENGDFLKNADGSRKIDKVSDELASIQIPIGKDGRINPSAPDVQVVLEKIKVDGLKNLHDTRDKEARLKEAQELAVLQASPRVETVMHRDSSNEDRFLAKITVESVEDGKRVKRVYDGEINMHKAYDPNNVVDGVPQKKFSGNGDLTITGGQKIDPKTGEVIGDLDMKPVTIRDVPISEKGLIMLLDDKKKEFNHNIASIKAPAIEEATHSAPEVNDKVKSAAAAGNFRMKGVIDPSKPVDMGSLDFLSSPTVVAVGTKPEVKAR